MQNDNIHLPPNFSKTFSVGTVLNLKGLNSCLDLVGGQHRDIFLQPAASDQDIK